MEHKFCPYCMNPVEGGKPCGVCGLTEGSYTPSPHHLPLGTVLKERYLVGRVLGEGGFGITYIGCDLQLELKVAIKEYFPTDKASRMSQASLDVSSYTGAAGVSYGKGLKKFLQEARTIARMDKQPVIVNVRDFFEVNRTAYIVMEYVEGTTFKELVEQRGGRIPAGELLYLIEPLFFALGEMHGNSLIHRDISPENLMLEKGEVRLLDFGCARETADGGNTLTIALKHGYAPVEQYQSKGQGPWTDVYALAATIYYCLTGRKPPQAMDRLLEDGLIPPRQLGVELTQRQEQALLRGMGVSPRRRFQSMEEFHTALYEGFLPGGAAGQGREPDPLPAPEGGSPELEQAEEVPPAPGGADRKPATPAAWLRQNRLLAGGCAAALALVLLLAAALPRLLGDDYEAAQTGEPSNGLESAPSTQEPSASPNVDNLALFMETVEWLRLDDMELDGTELRAKLDALPIDGLFAGAVHVNTLEELDTALDRADRPIVIDADIDLSTEEHGRNNQVPILVSEGVTVSVGWDDQSYENAAASDATWAVNGSIFINRGTVRGRIIMGGWESADPTNVLLNYGTIYSDLGAGYDCDSHNVVVNLGALYLPRAQYRQTSFYNLGTLLHGFIAPEGETPLVTTKLGGDYFIDLIGCYFYNGGGIVLEGRNSEKWGRLDVANGSRFVNAGSIQLGNYGEVNNHATLFNRGEIVAGDNAAHLFNMGWLLNIGPDCALDTARCDNVGLVQAGTETSIDLSAVRDGGGGAVLPFHWRDGWDGPADIRLVSSSEEFYAALEDRSCALIGLGDGAALTLTEDLILTKGLAIPDTGSLTMDGASLTVAGETGYLCADGPIGLGGGVFTVRDEAVVSVRGLRDCGGLTVRNQGYLMLREGLRPNDGAVIQLSDARYLSSIGPLELHGAQVSIDRSLLRGTGGIYLNGCAVDIAQHGELLTDGCGVHFDGDTVITNYGGLHLNGWDTQELACQTANYGEMSTNSEAVFSGSLVNEGSLTIWTSPNDLVRVSGRLENRGTVEFTNGGKFQPWAAGTVTGMPQQYVAD